MRSLLDVMAAVGVDSGADVDLTPNEDWRRVNTEGSKSKNAAYIVRPGLKGGVMVTFKNHSTGASANWWSDGSMTTTVPAPRPTKPPSDYFIGTKQLFDALENTSGAHSPYLKAKQVPSFRIARYSTTQRETLIPIQDRRGQLVAIQRIPDPPHSSDKRVHGRGGLYCQIHGNPSHLALVEGFATGASVRLITGYTVAVTFSTAGMIKFAEELAQSTKALPEIVIFADNHLSTAKKIGKNPGIEAAKHAANVIGNTRIFAPPMNGDWNDLVVERGLDTARLYCRNQYEVG